MLSLARDLGLDMKGRVRTDSTTGRSIAMRRGLGKTRHIHVQYLWVQERLFSKDFELLKIPTKDNVSDMLTKYLDAVTMDKFCSRIGLIFSSGRHVLAPKMIECKNIDIANLAYELICEVNGLSPGNEKNTKR